MNHSEGLALPNYKSLSTQTRYYAPLLGLLPDNRPVSIPISPPSAPPPPLTYTHEPQWGPGIAKLQESLNADTVLRPPPGSTSW